MVGEHLDLTDGSPADGRRRTSRPKFSSPIRRRAFRLLRRVHARLHQPRRDRLRRQLPEVRQAGAAADWPGRNRLHDSLRQGRVGMAHQLVARRWPSPTSFIAGFAGEMSDRFSCVVGAFSLRFAAFQPMPAFDRRHALFTANRGAMLLDFEVQRSHAPLCGHRSRARTGRSLLLGARSARRRRGSQGLLQRGLDGRARSRRSVGGKRAFPSRAAKKVKLAPNDVLLELFDELADRPEQQDLRYVLTLLLVRRRVLRFDTAN